MRLCLFEDAGVLNLEPLTLTRPAWALRCGAATLAERQQRRWGRIELGAVVRPELADICRLEHQGMPINDADFLKGDALVLVNARWLPPAQVALDLSRPHVGLVDGQVAYVALPPGEGADGTPEAMHSWLEHCRGALSSHEVGGILLEYLWEFVDHNPEMLVQDLEWFQQSHPLRPIPSGMALFGPQENFVAASDAVVEPFVFADTRQGPVLIDAGAVIHSFSRLEGPCYVGKESWIMGAKLRGGTIGAKCRIGGEVEASIVQGYSNKYHDGFLGHSYIGSWVNLAAGTQTSDLRNDYGNVRVTVAGERVATGKSKIGSFIGDHSKTGLGALLNTGSVIGVFANVLPAGFLLPQVVPSFCQVNYGQVQERQDMRNSSPRRPSS